MTFGTVSYIIVYCEVILLKLKIGLLNDSFPPVIDGVANTVKAYADILSKEDDPVVITPKYPRVFDHYPYEVYRYLSVPTDKLIGYRSGTPFEPVAVAELLSKKFDLLHVHCPFASALLAINLKRLSRNRLPLVFTYHTKFDVDIEKRVPVRSFQKLITKFVVQNIKQMDEVWVVSAGAGENLRKLGYKGGYRIMPNGTDLERRRASDEAVAAFKEKRHIGEKEWVFLFVGRMMWYKNIELIVDAMQRLKECGVHYKMVMVGRGDDLFAIQQYIQEVGLNDRFIFTGPVYDREELRVCYSAADLFVFPSSYDTSGLVVKEAAACSCPSILVAGSCASEGVEDRVSGFLCAETADACADAILGAIADPAALKQVGANAAQTVYYSWEDSVKNARAAYVALLERRKAKKHFWQR